MRTASCLEKGARSTVDNANASPSPFSMSQPYASPVPSDHLSSTLLTPAMEVKSLLTRSRMNSAGLVSAVGAWSMPERYSFIFAALPKYATRPIERTITLSKPAKTDAGGWWIVHTTAIFCSLATFLRNVIMRTADAESTPEGWFVQE